MSCFSNPAPLADPDTRGAVPVPAGPAQRHGLHQPRGQPAGSHRHRGRHQRRHRETSGLTALVKENEKIKKNKKKHTQEKRKSTVHIDTKTRALHKYLTRKHKRSQREKNIKKVHRPKSPSHPPNKSLGQDPQDSNPFSVLSVIPSPPPSFLLLFFFLLSNASTNHVSVSECCCRVGLNYSHLCVSLVLWEGNPSHFFFFLPAHRKLRKKR